MSARPTSPLRSSLGAAVAAVVLLAAGCSTAGTQPRDYGADYKKNFMFGCTGVEPDQDPKLASRSFCNCFYGQLVEKVPFSEAEEFEKEQAKAESGKDIVVPDNIQTIIDGCAEATDPEPAAG